MKLCLYGASGFGKEVYDIAFRINEKYAKWDEIFFIDDYPDNEKVYGNNKLLSLDELKGEYDKDNFELVIAIGEPSVRKKTLQKSKRFRN